MLNKGTERYQFSNSSVFPSPPLLLLPNLYTYKYGAQIVPIQNKGILFGCGFLIFFYFFLNALKNFVFSQSLGSLKAGVAEAFTKVLHHL